MKFVKTPLKNVINNELFAFIVPILLFILIYLITCKNYNITRKISVKR